MSNYVPPILVVGIGYRVDEFPEMLPLRVRDFTPTLDPSREGPAPEMMGGAAKFLAFIRDVLKPGCVSATTLTLATTPISGNRWAACLGPTCC